VTVRDGAGAPHDASVYDNSYAIGIPSGAVSISWVAADGSKGGVDIPAVAEPASP
jgi:hypothetical protein